MSEAVTINGRGLLRDREAADYLGMSRSFFLQNVDLGALPASVVDRPRYRRWAAEDIHAAREGLQDRLRAAAKPRGTGTPAGRAAGHAGRSGGAAGRGAGR